MDTPIDRLELVESLLKQHRGYLEASSRNGYGNQSARMFEDQQRRMASLQILVQLLEGERDALEMEVAA